MRTLAATATQPRAPLSPCSGWQWDKSDSNTLELTIRTAAQQLLASRAAAAATAPAPAREARPATGPHSPRSSSSSSSLPVAAASAVAAAPPALVLSVAGRTDRGVSALSQVASFYTWDSGLQAQVSCGECCCCCSGSVVAAAGAAAAGLAGHGCKAVRAHHRLRSPPLLPWLRSC